MVDSGHCGFHIQWGTFVMYRLRRALCDPGGFPGDGGMAGGPK